MRGTSKRLLARSRRVVGRIFGRRGVDGFVEALGPNSIEGWAIDKRGGDLRLVIRVAHAVFPLEVIAVERSDVAELHGAPFIKSGFRCDLSPAVIEALGAAVVAGQPIEVLANGCPLKILASPMVGLPLRQDDLGITLKVPGMSLTLESWGHFRIRGQGVWHTVPRSDGWRLQVSGVGLECVAELDVLSTGGVFEFGFQIEIPATVWAAVPGNEVLELVVVFDGKAVNSEPISLTRARAARWIRDVGDMPESPEKQYLALLALEHIRCGGIFPVLDSKGKRFVIGFARAMRLDEYALSTADSEDIREAVPAESASTLVLWRAMHRLNDLLRGFGERESIFDLIMKVMKEQRLMGEAREWYLFLAVQLTCKSGEFEKLRAILDFGRLRSVAGSGRADHMTLALPAMVADNMLAEAGETLEAVSRCASDDWMHTACIRYALDELRRLEDSGLAESVAAEKVRYAYIALVDRLRGDWFARHHDLELVQGLAGLVADMGMFTDWLRRDVVAAAIRNYGLCPSFWEFFSNERPLPRSPDLMRARDYWEQILRVFDQWASHGSARSEQRPRRLAALAEPLAWFHRWGNPEALSLAREALANSWPELSEEVCASTRRLVDMVLANNGNEVIGLACHPLGKKGTVDYLLPEADQRISSTLRLTSEGNKSPAFELQLAAARLLWQALRETDTTKIADLLPQVERGALRLAPWSSGCLGVDLLASCYAMTAAAGLDAEPVLMRLREAMRQVVLTLAAEQFPPAPFIAALMRLEGLTTHPLVKALVLELRAALRERFGNRLDSALYIPTKALLRADLVGRGWPSDTLVLIDCASPGEEAQRAIRRTWLQKLIERGIPYLFVGGDGVGSAAGDVLMHDPGEPEFGRCRRTLAMFDWAYRHTDAQYVLKLYDTCYLEVDRYFDALSYRKHHYYGRIVGSDPGQMPRVAGECLDKSPEPARWADGSGGYLLSRAALGRLRDVAATSAGGRLIATSHREDKLVGDLLALAGIGPADDDYEAYERHSTVDGARPVGKGENIFFPSQITPTMVVHAGNAAELGSVHQLVGTAELAPKKIWPTYWTPMIRRNSNQLELLTDRSKAEMLLGQEIVVVAVVRNEMTMLPHFLAHYRNLGIGCFIFADNCSDDGSREYLNAQSDVVLYSVDTEYRHSHYGVSWQQAMLGNHCLGKWVLLADADEFLVFEDSEHRSLQEFVRGLEDEGNDGALLYMIDMYPYGDLDEACFDKAAPFEAAPYFDKQPLIELRFGGGQFSNSRNFVNGLRHRIAPSRINAYVSQKYALFKYKPWMRLSEGVHYAANMRVGSQPAFFAHFKYHSGFKHKVETEIRRNQHFNGAEEYRRYAGMLAEGHGGFGADGLTEKFSGSRSFIELLKAIE